MLWYVPASSPDTTVTFYFLRYIEVISTVPGFCDVKDINEMCVDLHVTNFYRNIAEVNSPKLYFKKSAHKIVTIVDFELIAS